MAGETCGRAGRGAAAAAAGQAVAARQVPCLAAACDESGVCAVGMGPNCRSVL